MVMILACLSAMLTLGGGAMALYGADMIRSESGLALTGSGVTMTSAGLVLLGITCVFAEMRRMRRLMEAEEILPPVTVAVQHQPPAASMPSPPMASPSSASPPSASPPSASPAVPSPPTPAPAAASLAAAPAKAEAAKPTEPAREAPHGSPSSSAPAATAGSSPSAPPPGVMPPPLDIPERARPAGSGIPAEAMASLVGSAAMLKGARGAGRGEASPDSPGGVLAPHGEPVEVPSRVEPVSTAPAEGAPSGPPATGTEGASAETAFDLPPDTGPRTMLATYNSGGITYFMYSDSSIEADMTGGRYRFASMDELRTFIETGKGGALVTPADAPAPAEAEKV
jgi:hypothetical protein